MKHTKNRSFREPLDESEVKQTAYIISTWCWSGGGARCFGLGWRLVSCEVRETEEGVQYLATRVEATPNQLK